MKNILKIISVASISIAALVSCDQENIKATYTPEQENEVSFAAEVYTNTEIPATADTINVVITRNSADNAVTVPLTTTLPSEITVPSSVSFEAGEYQTNVVLQLAILGGVRYTGTISISDSTMFNSNTSLYPTVSLTLQQAYNWQSLGNGEFYDNICGMLLTPEIMQATNALQPLYRIMNPYTAEASEAIAAAIGGATGGPKSEYIEFTVDESTGLLTWSGCWNAGALVDATISNSSLNYYFGTESPFSGGENLPQECGEITEGLFQFAPHVSAFANAEETSGWTWSGTYEWMSLPGAETTVSEYLGL